MTNLNRIRDNMKTDASMRQDIKGMKPTTRKSESYHHEIMEASRRNQAELMQKFDKMMEMWEDIHTEIKETNNILRSVR